MLDLNLFSITSFRNGNIVAVIVSLGEFGILFSLPLWFQNVLGYTAFQTGLALLALAGGSFLASGLTAPIGRKRGTIFIVRLGIVLEIIGIAGLAIFLRPDSTWLTTTPLLLTYGIGVGLATAQLTGVVLRTYHWPAAVRRRAPRAQLGRWVRRWASPSSGRCCSPHSARYDAALADLGVSEAQRVQLVDAVKDSAGAAIPGLAANPGTAAVAEPARVAFTDASRVAALTAAGFLVIGLGASLSPGSRRRTSLID